MFMCNGVIGTFFPHHYVGSILSPWYMVQGVWLCAANMSDGRVSMALSLHFHSVILYILYLLLIHFLASRVSL